MSSNTRIVVVGAEALIRRNWDCSVVTRSGVMSSLDDDMGDRVQAVMAAVWGGLTIDDLASMDLA